MGGQCDACRVPAPVLRADSQRQPLVDPDRAADGDPVRDVHQAERGQPATVEWRNELDGAFPVVVTTAPAATDASGVPVQCVPGLSGGMPDQNAAALAGHTVVHLHGGLVPAFRAGI